MSTTTTDTYNQDARTAIRSIIAEMIDTGQMMYTRAEVLNSQDAARDVIARLPDKFRAMSTTMFRHFADGLDKTKAENGGMPLFSERAAPDKEKQIVAKLNTWREEHETQHSDEYKRIMASPEHRERCREWKRFFGYTCGACGKVRAAHHLEIHHYHYRTLGYEIAQDEEGGRQDVCAVCAPSTGSACHALLDIAREMRAGTFRGDDRGLFS